MKTIRTRKLLSYFEPLPVQLKVSIDGQIEVTVPGTDALNLSTNDSSPIDVNYISFSTWGTAEGRFFYDCPQDGIDENLLELLTPELTPSERLRSNLFSADFSSVPENLTEVYFNLDIIKASYNYQRSILTTQAVIHVVSIRYVFQAGIQIIHHFYLRITNFRIGLIQN